MTKRRRFSVEFKARVALEALRGDQTIQGDRGPAQAASESGERVEAAGGGRAWPGVFRQGRTCRQTAQSGDP